MIVVQLHLSSTFPNIVLFVPNLNYSNKYCGKNFSDGRSLLGYLEPMKKFD